jgi:hypothetical protein
MPLFNDCCDQVHLDVKRMLAVNTPRHSRSARRTIFSALFKRKMLGGETFTVKIRRCNLLGGDRLGMLLSSAVTKFSPDGLHKIPC